MTLAAMLLPLSVFLSVSFLSPYRYHLSSYPRQRTTGDIKGFIVTILLWIFFVTEYIVCIQGCFREDLSDGVGDGASVQKMFSDHVW